MAAGKQYVHTSAQGSIRQCMITGMDCDGGCDNCETARNHGLAEGGIYIRPEVVAFAEMMESVLSDHDGDKGDSWKVETTEYLWASLEHKFEDVDVFVIPPDNATDREKLIDLANYAMMLWHRLGEEEVVA